MRAESIQNLMMPRGCNEVKSFKFCTEMMIVELLKYDKDVCSRSAWDGFFQCRPNYTAYERFLRKQKCTIEILQMYTWFDLLRRAFHNIDVVDETLPVGLTLRECTVVLRRVLSTIDKIDSKQLHEMARAGLWIGKILENSPDYEAILIVFDQVIAERDLYVEGPENIFEYLTAIRSAELRQNSASGSSMEVVGGSTSTRKDVVSTEAGVTAAGPKQPQKKQSTPSGRQLQYTPDTAKSEKSGQIADAHYLAEKSRSLVTVLEATIKGLKAQVNGDFSHLKPGIYTLTHVAEGISDGDRDKIINSEAAQFDLFPLIKSRMKVKENSNMVQLLVEAVTLSSILAFVNFPCMAEKPIGLAELVFQVIIIIINVYCTDLICYLYYLFTLKVMLTIPDFLYYVNEETGGGMKNPTLAAENQPWMIVSFFVCHLQGHGKASGQRGIVLWRNYYEVWMSRLEDTVFRSFMELQNVKEDILSKQLKAEMFESIKLCGKQTFYDRRQHSGAFVPFCDKDDEFLGTRLAHAKSICEDFWKDPNLDDTDTVSSFNLIDSGCVVPLCDRYAALATKSGDKFAAKLFDSSAIYSRDRGVLQRAGPKIWRNLINDKLKPHRLLYVFILHVCVNANLLPDVSDMVSSNTGVNGNLFY